MRFFEQDKLKGITTSRGFYLVFSEYGITEVRLCAFRDSPKGLWLPSSVNNRDWKAAAYPVIEQWENATTHLGTKACTDRDTLFDAAYKIGPLCLDWFKDGEWLCSISKPKEVC